MTRPTHQRLLLFVVGALLVITGSVVFDRPEHSATALGVSPKSAFAPIPANVTADLLGGQDLVYACSVAGVYDLCLVPGDGSPQINLTNTPTLSESWPTWSPEGDRIAYSSVPAGPVTRLFTPVNSSIVVAQVPTTAALVAGATITPSTHAAPRGFMPACSKSGKFLSYSQWRD